MDSKCKLCGKEFKGVQSLGVHIKRTHNIETKEYYDKFLKKPDEGICQTCGKQTNFWHLGYGYLKHCCKECISGDIEVKNKKEQTCLNNWGVSNSFHSPNGRKQYYKIGTAKTKMINKSINKLQNQCKTISNLKYIDKNTYTFHCLCCNTDRTQEHYITVHRIYRNENPCLNCVPIGHPTSTGENELFDFIKSIYNGNVIKNDYITIKPKELDIYLPDLKLAFEFDGTFWHADQRFYKPDSIVGRKGVLAKDIWEYDNNKIEICKEIGITLTRINEYDWKNNNEKVKEQIKQLIGIK